MKHILLIAIATNIFAFLQFDSYKDDKIVFKDEPLEKNFKDSEWQCTAEQLEIASKQFMKCDGTPVFRDCYAKMIKKHCERKYF